MWNQNEIRKAEIFTTGYPRSGNTWLWRTLCDLFEAPMAENPQHRMKTEFSRSLRPDYIIRKTHWYSNQWYGRDRKGYLIDRAYIILTMRDPRDMVVSMMYYRKQQDLNQAIGQLANNGYPSFIEGWERHPPDYWLKYEDMHSRPEVLLNDIWHLIEPDNEVSQDHIQAVIDHHKFDKWLHLDRHAHRKGIVGDWKNHFTRDQAQVFAQLYNPILLRYGYEEDRDWWKEVE